MKIKKTVLAVVIGSMSSACWGSGFGISGKSASNLGNAFSGTTVLAEDASVAYTNPAAMQDIDGQEFSFLMNYIGSDVTFTDDGSSTSGDDRSNVDDPHYVPNFYAVTPLNDETRFGFGIYAPFGLGLDYEDDWKGRYITTGSNLKIINFSPNVSYDVDEKLNLGFGVDFQYLDAELANAVDFGTICYDYEAYGVIPGGACAASGLAPQQNDGSQTLTGSNWAIGYSLGLTYDISDATRFGMAFHSATRHDISGKSDFEGQPDLLASVFSDTDADLTLVLPETLSLGLGHKVSPRLQLMADATWTRWSRYDELVVTFDNNVPTSRTEQNWKDVWRLSVGGNYRINDKWLMRAGFSHDPTPVPDAEHRSPRTPDETRNWISLGSNARVSKNMTVDVAVSYAKADSIKIDNTDSMDHNLQGEFENEILYLTAQLNWRF
ncbi:MAG: outer membrane protein transport protein [Pseudomonadota bacterium]